MDNQKITALKGFTNEGGKITISLDHEGSGGAVNLSQIQMDAYKKAQLIVKKINGADIERAKKLLEAVGFEVFYY